MKKEEFKAGARFRVKGYPTIYIINTPPGTNNELYIKTDSRGFTAFVLRITDYGVEVGMPLMENVAITFFLFSDLELIQESNPITS